MHDKPPMVARNSLNKMNNLMLKLDAGGLWDTEIVFFIHHLVSFLINHSKSLYSELTAARVQSTMFCEMFAHDVSVQTGHNSLTIWIGLVCF
jgi:hypothetical protein